MNSEERRKEEGIDLEDIENDRVAMKISDKHTDKRNKSFKKITANDK